MGSSKVISNREIFYLVFLLQQSGVFWLLPYFWVRGNGTAGIGAIFGGLITAVSIIWVGQYWGTRIGDLEFIAALRQSHKILGSLLGGVCCMFYLIFAILMLYCFVDVVQKQILTETPHFVLCMVTMLLAGWLSRGGLESIARFAILCIGALILMVIVSIAGTMDLFTPEAALPLIIYDKAQLESAFVQSAFCYSGLLSVFMLYPASGEKHSLHKVLYKAVGMGAVMLIVWTAYALCVLGAYSLQTVLWIPVHLARMVEIGTLINQIESLFIVLWMAIVVTIGSLFLWCASAGVHQLIGKHQSEGLHWSIILAAFMGMLYLRNTMGLLQMVTLLAKAMLVILPILLIAILLLTPKRRKS